MRKTITILFILFAPVACFAQFAFYGGSDAAPPDPGTAAGQMTFWDGSSWTHTETTEMFWDDTNKLLGIGTATPAARIDVRDNGTPQLSVVDFHADDRNLWSMRIFNDTYGTGASNAFRYFMENTGVFEFLAPVSIGFNTNNSSTPIGEVLWLGSDKRVGINNQAPNNKLEITDTANPQLRLSYDGSNYATFSVGSTGNLDIVPTGSVTFSGGYDRHIVINPSAATLGPTAPTPTTIGTARGLLHDADGEQSFLTVEVPGDWDGASDITFEILWSPSSGDALVDTETVVHDISYRSIADGEAVDNGTAVDDSATYTQSGAGTDKEQINTMITLDYDNANQPLTAGDIIYLVYNHDVSSGSYGNGVIVWHWELKYNATKMPYQ